MGANAVLMENQVNSVIKKSHVKQDCAAFPKLLVGGLGGGG